MKTDHTDRCWNTIGVFSRDLHSCERLGEYLHCHNCPVYVQAGRALLDRPLESDYRQELTTIVAAEGGRQQRRQTTVFVFQAGREWLALPAACIVEIIPMGPIHPIPHRSDTVLRGLTNVRGRLELCFSLGAILGIERDRTESAADSPARLVAARHRDFKIVFPARTVLGIIRYESDNLEELPVTVAHARRKFARGIIDHQGRDIALLDLDTIFDELEKHLA